MRKEKYIIAATKDREHFIQFSVMAECHRQHIWKGTELEGISKTGACKIEQLASEGYMFYAHNVPNQPKIIGW